MYLPTSLAYLPPLSLPYLMESLLVYHLSLPTLPYGIFYLPTYIHTDPILLVHTYADR